MYSIMITTYNNFEYFKLCVDSILENSHYKTNQLCIHINDYDKTSMEYLDSKNIKYIATPNIGIPPALNLCIDMSTHNNVIFSGDDTYFTKNWDYYLHQWEIELNKKFPDYVKIIAYRWCEPGFGSFPPICDAGKDIETFNKEKLYKYISKNSVHDVDRWMYNSLFPKEIISKCRFSDEFSPKDCTDIDQAIKMVKYLKDNKIKFLIFSVKDSCVYHFQRIASEKSKTHNKNGSNNSKIFETKWKMNIQEACNLIYEEEKRSISLIRKELFGIEEKTEESNIEKDNIKRFIIQGYYDILKRPPDPNGLSHYTESIYTKRKSKDEFLEELRTSEDYKNIP